MALCPLARTSTGILTNESNYPSDRLGSGVRCEPAVDDGVNGSKEFVKGEGFSHVRIGADAQDRRRRDGLIRRTYSGFHLSEKT